MEDSLFLKNVRSVRSQSPFDSKQEHCQAQHGPLGLDLTRRGLQHKGMNHMSRHIIKSGHGDDLPESVQKVLQGVQEAGEIGGTIAGSVAGIPLALTTMIGAKLIGKKSDRESEAMADRVFEISAKVGQTIGKIAPVAVLAAPFLLFRHFQNRS